MRTICVSDVTLKNFCDDKLTFKSKLEIAGLLDELKVDYIELNKLTQNKADLVFVHTVLGFLKNAKLAIDMGDTLESVKYTIDSLKGSDSLLILNVPISPVQMEYKLHLKGSKLLDYIKSQVEYATQLGGKVQVNFEDISRAEKSFLEQAIMTAIDSGAKMISLNDCAEDLLPEDFAEFISGVIKDLPKLKELGVTISCGNNLKLATACQIAGIKAGAIGVKTAVGVNDIASLEEFLDITNSLGLKLGFTTNINTTIAKRVYKKILSEQSTDEKKSINFNAFDEKIIDSSVSEKQLTDIITSMGYSLSLEDLGKVYESFLRIAKKKSSVNIKELDAIIATSAQQVPATFKLLNYVINAGNNIVTTASITLEKSGKEHFGLSDGDGPIDAAFKAIENVIGEHFELDEFKVEAITEGKDAMGEGIVKLRYNGKIFAGSGISTDIIGASIRAYISAVNKIFFEEKK